MTKVEGDSSSTPEGQHGKASNLLSKILEDLQSFAAARLAGHERLAITEVFRSLDMCAFAFQMAPDREHLRQHDHARQWMLKGSSAALRPLLNAVANSDGPMPWGPSNPKWTAIIDSYLIQCGQLAWLHRLVMLEKYGLSHTSVRGKSMRIEAASDGLEAADRHSHLRMTHQDLGNRGISADIALKKGQLKRIRRQLDKKSGRAMGGWFIQHSEDEKVFDRNKRRIREVESIWIESEALPDTAIIGGKSFRDWKDACCNAAANVLHHIEFATRLRANHADLDLRNLLTMFWRRDDVALAWERRGLDPLWIEEVTQAMMLDYTSTDRPLEHHEMQFPYYVDMGKDFVLAPALSALLNPFAGVVRHLKSHYRFDWDRAVDSREAVFRAEIAQVFSSSRFIVHPSGMSLRREDGTLLTDVDAVILDRMTGTMALIQLKWHDVFAMSLRERESRKRKLLAANKWVERVHTWVGKRSSADISALLGMPPMQHRQVSSPVILVVARYAANFTGAEKYDPRSGWLSWSELVQASTSENAGSDILRQISINHSGARHLARETRSNYTPMSSKLQFPDLDVEVVIMPK